MMNRSFAAAPLPIPFPFMKYQQLSQDHNRKAAIVPSLPSAKELNQNKVALTASPDEVARRAYFNYLNEGSIPGREEKHWLEAEAQLIAEMAREAQSHPGSLRS
jgi:hypothetical protein